MAFFFGCLPHMDSASTCISSIISARRRLAGCGHDSHALAVCFWASVSHRRRDQCGNRSHGKTSRILRGQIRNTREMKTSRAPEINRFRIRTATRREIQSSETKMFKNSSSRGAYSLPYCSHPVKNHLVLKATNYNSSSDGCPSSHAFTCVL